MKKPSATHARPDRSRATDEQLAAQTQAGLLAAFEELVYRYEARLYRFLHARTGNAADARDLTQTAFVAAYRALGRFDTRRPFAPWLFAITRRAMIDHFRSQSRELSEPPPSDEPAVPLVDSCDPYEILAAREDHHALWQLARRTLSHDQFAVLWLKYEEDLPVTDIARALGKTTIHVKVLLHRARRNLLRELNDGALAATPVAIAEVLL